MKLEQIFDTRKKIEYCREVFIFSTFMKKHFLSITASVFCLLVPTISTLAQSPTTKPKTQVNTVKTVPNPMAAIEQNIDRRLTYFNRYKNNKDWESITKLVSTEKRDFSINFLKYIQSAPTFTIKRDPTVRIIKTPLDEYIITVLVTMNSVEKKASMTFIEEKTDRGTKWSIADSNIHIQIPLPPVSENSGDTADNTPPPATDITTTSPLLNTDDGQENAQPVTETPPSSIVTPPESQPIQDLGSSALAKTIAPSSPPTLWSPVVIVSLILFGILIGVLAIIFYARKRGNKKRALSAAAALASSQGVVPQILSQTAPAVPLDADLNSNATLKTIEEVHSVPENIVSAPLDISTISEAPLVTEAPIVIKELPLSEPSELSEVSDSNEWFGMPNDSAVSEVPPHSEEEIPLAFTDPSLSLPSRPVLQEALESRTQEEMVSDTDDLLPMNPFIPSQEEIQHTLMLTPEEVYAPAWQPSDTPPTLSLNDIIVASEKWSESDNARPAAIGTESPHSLFENVLNDKPTSTSPRWLFDTILQSDS